MFCNKTSNLQCCGGKEGKLQMYSCEISHYTEIFKGN